MQMLATVVILAAPIIVMLMMMGLVEVRCSSLSYIDTLLQAGALGLVAYVIKVTQRLDKEVRNGGE